MGCPTVILERKKLLRTIFSIQPPTSHGDQEIYTLMKKTNGIGGLFLPLVWLRSSWPVNMGLYMVIITGYCSVLFFPRVITLEEIISMSRAFRKRGALVATQSGRAFAQIGTR
jgi:hypothetical protein